MDFEEHLWWWIALVVWLTDEKRLALFPTGTIVRDPHHLESPARGKQDFKESLRTSASQTGNLLQDL